MNIMAYGSLVFLSELLLLLPRPTATSYPCAAPAVFFFHPTAAAGAAAAAVHHYKRDLRAHGVRASPSTTSPEAHIMSFRIPNTRSNIGGVLELGGISGVPKARTQYICVNVGEDAGLRQHSPLAEATDDRLTLELWAFVL